jgi:hypothetical protein
MLGMTGVAECNRLLNGYDRTISQEFDLICSVGDEASPKSCRRAI